MHELWTEGVGLKLNGYESETNKLLYTCDTVLVADLA